MLGKFIFIILIVFMFVNTDQSEASYITKKSDTSKIVEKIEKEYATGKISKSECTKKKSKALKLGKVSETICDNVEVKTVKKETKEEKKVEYIKKKEKKEKKAKKEFLKKTKDLSKKAKSWITKKIKIKKEKHYKTIAQLPKADFYFTGIDDKGNIFIGYFKEQYQDDGALIIDTRTFWTMYEGKIFQNDGKTQCIINSFLNDKTTTDKIYKANVVIKCPNEDTFVGVWNQSGNQGYGIAVSDKGIKLDYIFSENRNDSSITLLSFKEEAQTFKKLVKQKEKKSEDKDTIKPVIKISYNKITYDSSKNKKVTIESSETNYEITGLVSDMGGSIDKVQLRLDGRPIALTDGGFTIKRSSNKEEELWLTAFDGGGNSTDFRIIVKIYNAKNVVDVSAILEGKKYYALIIGNNDYADGEWEDLESPINDITAIAKILKKKYKFIIPDKFILKNASKNEIEEAFDDLNEILTENDYLLIYYAGHGQRNTDIQRAFWIPTDAKKNCCRNWINTSNITDMVGIFKAKHVLLMIDSCYSGLTKGEDENITDTEENLDDGVVIKKWLTRKVRLYISSGSNEPVLDRGAGIHSYFAYKFIEVLKTNNSNLGSQEVFNKVDKYVQNNASQRPKYRVIKETGHNDGQFVFAVRN